MFSAVIAAAMPLAAQQRERPENVEICSLLADPFAYHHKLIKVTGRVSRGFEDFTLDGTGCDEARPFWLEYGGPQPAEVTYCCVGEQDHPPNGTDPLWIDGIRTSLDRNGVFKRFDSRTKQLNRGETVRATLVGRVFCACLYTTESGEQVEVGYGHFGIFSLFVIERVLEVGR